MFGKKTKKLSNAEKRRLSDKLENASDRCRGCKPGVYCRKHVDLAAVEARGYVTYEALDADSPTFLEDVARQQGW